MASFFPPVPPIPPMPETALPPPPPPSLVSESEESSSGAEAVATLLVRHLPEGMPHDLVYRLFSHYGASGVRPCAGGRLRNCAFVDFKDEVLATQAQTQLNRLRFLGKVLKVERVGKPNLKSADQKSDSQSKKDSTANSSHLKEYFTNQKNLMTGEPIAPRLGVDYPFPPHLEYAYPPPDGNILTNIVNALIAVPRFYTQVLHLMNKMNIPAPFRMALPTPPLPPPVPAAPPPSPPLPPTTTAMKSNLNDLSSEESEMESSEEDAESGHRRKRRRREAIVGPAVDKGVAHEDVGLKPVSLVPKDVPVIRKKNPVLQIKVAPKPVLKETMEKDISVKEPALYNEHSLIATPQEIESGKLPREEILSLPMFKNYSPGDPASVLYVKNLAKDVVVDDFYFIFGSLFGSIEAVRVGLTIKLMQEGRMRGQAFVTFPSVDLAQRALNLVNGYVFKGKPIIIQFGRSSGAAKAN